VLRSVFLECYKGVTEMSQGCYLLLLLLLLVLLELRKLLRL
jgi:hypothetical protein